MGGRGSYSSWGKKYGTSSVNTASSVASQNVANQAPNAQNTPVTPGAVTALSQMSDDQLAQLFNNSKNIQMPNQLADASDVTQKFVFTAGLNELPTVLDAKAFNQFMSDNGLTSADILSRSVGAINYTNASGTRISMTAQDCADMIMYSKFNYIGGKHGGQAYGAGTYFDHVNGHSTGYGGSRAKTMNAVLNPKTARVIDLNTLIVKAKSFDVSHPKFARATGGVKTGWSGNNISVYALAMGYNAISDSSRNDGYINVIDRSALVYKA